MELKEKVAIVTGSSRGIGAATAVRFAREGCKVVIVYNQSKANAEEVQRRIQVFGGKSFIVKADVTKPEEIDEMFTKVLKAFKTIDILVNNAGIAPELPFLKDTPDMWQNVLQTNVQSVMMVSQKFARFIKEQGKEGLILNTSSQMALPHLGGEDSVMYCASKAAINSITANLARTLAPSIRVNSVAPGCVYTDIWNFVEKEEADEYALQAPIKRWVKAEEIADAFIFLAKNDAMTGQVIYVDGGFSIK